MESCSNQQRILITGVSGLIGAILFNHLTENYSRKYQVVGLDQHVNLSTRYQSTNVTSQEIKKVLPIPADKFFQCDITDRMKLHKIIEEQKIDIIIHLAALLEYHPDLENLSYVNINGTKNVFEAPGVHRIIYASTVRTVFAYLYREPYCSIRNDSSNDEIIVKNIPKLTVKDHPPLPDPESPAFVAYSQSKIIGEQMASDIVKRSSKSIICARFGWVNIENQPGKTWLRDVWLSHRDLCQFIGKVLDAPAPISGIYFAMSNNYRLWIDLNDAKRDFGFIPQDGAEKL